MLHSHIKRIGFGFTIILLISTLPPISLPPQASSQVTDPLSLAVTPAPSAVPADGGEYSIVFVQIRNNTGFPIPAPADTEIILSSSRSEVGEVERTITIPKGVSYSLAKFRTTKTSGTTTITAAATGFGPGNGEVVTIDPSSSPMRLVVELGPKQLLPEPGAKGMVVIQLRDVNGVLARATSDILVSISSSHPSIATVDSPVLIEAGSSYGQAYFYTTLTPGTATITASASGYATDSEVLTIQGPIPSKLAVYAAPSEIPERAGTNTTIAVQLQDLNGIPVRAPIDVYVTVTSTNTTVGSISQQSIMIESGQTYAVTQFTGSLVGSTQITAAAQQYATGFATINVVRPGLADTGSLAIYLAPPVVLPDDRSHRALYLQLKDSNGQTVRVNRDVNVHLASSNTEVGSVESDVVIRSGFTYSVATFQSTHAAGSTTITASAADFVTTSATMTVAGAVPYKIAVSVTPTQLPSDRQPHTSLVLQLQGFNGEPVNAPSDVAITLSSSKTDIGIVDETVVLPSGMSTTVATFYSSLVTGITTITASASGYVPGSFEVVTVEPAPSNLISTIAPSIIPADSEAHQTIIIQLQDSAGTPARARYDIPISISSSNPSVGVADSSVILREGETFVSASFRTSSQPGITTITVLSSGFAGSSSKLTTILYPFTLTFSPKEVMVNVTDTATLTLSLTSSGAPVPDAVVSWRTTTGSLLDESKITDASGSATSRFSHDEPDSATVTVTVSKKGYQTTSSILKIKILPLLLRITIPLADLSVNMSKPIGINVTVLSGNQPVQDVDLSWRNTMGTLTRADDKTDVDGVGEAIFFSNEAGTAEINITASKKGYVDASGSLTIDIQTPPVVTVTNTIPTTTEESGFTLFGLNLYVIIGLVGAMVVGVGVIVFFMFRSLRRRGSEEFDEGELGELLDGEE